MWRKKFSIFTSATRPYGLVDERRAGPSADMLGHGVARRTPAAGTSGRGAGCRASAARGSCGRTSRGRPATATPRSCRPGTASCRTPCARRTRCARNATSRNIAGRVDLRHEPVSSEVLQVHQAGNRQPAFDTGGRGTQTDLAAGFVEPDEEVEPRANPEIEQQEGRLERASPDELGLVGLPAVRGRHLDAAGAYRSLAGSGRRCGCLLCAAERERGIGRHELQPSDVAGRRTAV